MVIAGKDRNSFHQSVSKHVNQYSIVVQEYFQERVKLWLQTVGRKVFRIQHHWLRYEFAPSRGQIHAHMLVISDRKYIKILEDHIEANPLHKAAILSQWVKNPFI